MLTAIFCNDTRLDHELDILVRMGDKNCYLLVYIHFFRGSANIDNVQTDYFESNQDKNFVAFQQFSLIQ